MNITKKIIAFSGTHGTGKTTSVHTFARQYKMDNPNVNVGVLFENVIFSPYPINGKTTPESQLWIFTNHIQAELQYSSKYDIVISDRSSVDAIAYSRVAGFNVLADSMFELVKNHVQIYQTVYLKKMAGNNFLFDDSFRETGFEKARLDVEKCLEMYYDELGVEVVKI